MSTRDEVVAAAEALRMQLSDLKDHWPEARWGGFQAELLDWLGDFQRCRLEEDWLAAWDRLLAIASTYDLLEIVESAWLHYPAIPDIEDPGTGPHRGHDRNQLDEADAVISRSVGAVVARLRRFLDPTASAQIEPIEAYPEARVEGDVFEQQAFRLEVSVHAQPTPEAPRQAILPRFRRGSVDLEVVLSLQPQGAITSRYPLQHPLRVPEGCDSNRISFELFAVRPGHHRVDVSFLQGGVTRATLTVPVIVLAARERPSPGAVSTAVRTSLPVAHGDDLPRLALRIEPRGTSNGSQFLYVGLTDNKAGLLAEGITQIAEDAQQRLVVSCQRLGVELALRPPETHEDWLRGVGADWAAKLLPAAVNEALASHHYPERTSLHIDSRATWMPWELFFVGPPSQGRFLGDGFAVTRWHSNAQFGSSFGGAQAVLVAPRDSGLWVDKEKRALEQLTGAPVEESYTLRQFQELMYRETPVGFLHFACHGTVDADSHTSRASSLMRDAVPEPTEWEYPPRWHLRGVLLLQNKQPLQTSDIPRHSKHHPSPLKGAFVFLNACHAGLPSSSPWGHESWVNTFFEAGAVALVAPSWTIPDDYAGNFAWSLYQRLAADEPLAQAAWSTRKHLPGGITDRLGYAVYAFPEARRSRSPSWPQPTG